MRTRDTDLIVTMVDFERPGVGTHQYMTQESFENNVINNDYFQKALEAGLIKCLLTHQGRDYADNDKSGTPYDDLLATHPDLCGVVRDVWLDGAKAMASIDLFDGQAFPAAAKLKDLIKKGTFVGVSMATECEINGNGNYDITALLGCDFTLDNFFMGSGIVTIKKNFSRQSGTIRVNFSNRTLNQNFDEILQGAYDLNSVNTVQSNNNQSKLGKLYIGQCFQTASGSDEIILVFNEYATDNKEDGLLAYRLSEDIWENQWKYIWLSLTKEDLAKYFTELDVDENATPYQDLIVEAEKMFPHLLLLGKGEELPLKEGIQASNFANYKEDKMLAKNFAVELSDDEYNDLVEEHGEEYLQKNSPNAAPVDMESLNDVLDGQEPHSILLMAFNGKRYNPYEEERGGEPWPFNPNDDFFAFDGAGNLVSIEADTLPDYVAEKTMKDDFIDWCADQGYIEEETEEEEEEEE